jgi:putative molybdopterin biosynthesis protein
MQIKIKPSVYIHKKQDGLVESLDLSWVAGLLRAVQDGRSLQTAAESMDISYRTLWNRLKAAEKELDCRLLMSVKAVSYTHPRAHETLS